MLDFALRNPATFKLFDSTIHLYNTAYTNLNTHNSEYEKAVYDYWDSRELSLNFHSVFDYAVNNIHRTSILPLNSLLNEKVNNYLHTTSAKEQKKLKEEITITLNTILPILENNLTVLETKTRYFIDQLQIQKSYSP